MPMSLERMTRLASGKIQELPLLAVTWRVVMSGLFFAMLGGKFWEAPNMQLAIFTIGNWQTTKTKQAFITVGTRTKF